MEKVKRKPTITISNTNIVRIDGYIVCKLIDREGILFLQFCDKDNLRNQCRGTKYIEMPLSQFQNAIEISWKETN